MNETLTIAAVADLHARERPPHRYKDLFARASSEADVILLCGDLTDLGLPSEAEALADDLSASTVPVLGVLGNHDYQSGFENEVRNILSDAKLIFIDEDTYVIDGVGFAGIKGFCGGFGNHMLSSFGEVSVKQFVAEAVNEALLLERLLASLSTEKIAVGLHYAPIIETVEGEVQEIYAFLGSSRLRETIDRFPVNAVFHGHAHHGSLTGRTDKNIPVYNCALDLIARERGDEFILVKI